MVSCVSKNVVLVFQIFFILVNLTYIHLFHGNTLLLLFYPFFFVFFFFSASHRTPATRYDLPAPLADTLSKVELAAIRLSQDEHELQSTVNSLASCHEEEAKAKIALEDIQKTQPDSVRFHFFSFLIIHNTFITSSILFRTY